MAINPTLLAFKAVAQLAQTLPAGVLRAGSRTITGVIPRFDAERRIIVERNLARSTGRALGSAEQAKMVRDVFASYARYYTDTARLPTLTAAEVDRGFSYEGFVNIEDSVAAGKGTILVLPHLGGWEWAGSWLARVPGFDVTGVVEPLENDELREWMQGWREAVGMHVLPLGPGLGTELLRRLKANHIICLMSDRNLGDGGTEVEFFGERTTLPSGAATLAFRSGARIVPLSVYHRGHLNHAVVEPPVVVERDGRLRSDIERVTQHIAHRLEAQIRQAPTQWIVLQPNWPSDRLALDAHRQRASR